MIHSDLEEYSDRELEMELERRNKLRKEGFCSYCRRPLDSDLPCRHHEIGFYETGYVRTMKVERIS